MHIFISWSGELSKRIAYEIRNWLPLVMHRVKPFFTPIDIAKGAQWNEDIRENIKKSRLALICLTPENLNSPWINFETGALSMLIGENNICPLLFKIKSSEITYPLAQFQTTNFLQDEYNKLVHTINDCMEADKIDTSILDSNFDKWWGDLNTPITNYLKDEQTKERNTHKRSSAELLDELLMLSRNMISQHNDYKAYMGNFLRSIIDILNHQKNFTEISEQFPQKTDDSTEDCEENVFGKETIMDLDITQFRSPEINSSQTPITIKETQNDDTINGDDISDQLDTFFGISK